jgi:DNA-binding PadR family transcriptional regulator
MVFHKWNDHVCEAPEREVREGAGGGAMKLEHILLGVLLRQPSTGYDLKKYLDTQGRFLRSNTQMSQVYRSLTSMENRDWVTHTTEPRPGAQPAKVYEVTAEGATVFLDWLKGPYHPPTRFQDPELGARLSFGGFFTPEELLRLLDTEIDARREQIKRFRGRDRRLPRHPSAPYDEELADLVDAWDHATGTAAMDAHLAACYSLREDVARRGTHPSV